MAKHYIKDSDGNIAKTNSGEKLFYSDRDGDRPNNQTVYRKHNSICGDIFGDSSKVKSRYDPSKGKFKK